MCQIDLVNENLPAERFRQILIPFLTTFFLLYSLGFATFQRVQAEEETRVWVSPAVGNLVMNEGNQLIVDVLVENAQDLWSFDIKIKYDPSVVSLKSWSNGGMIYWDWKNRQVHDPVSGELWLVMLQLGEARQPASGDGNLIRLTFEGVQPGNSAIELTQVILGERTGTLTYPSSENGVINTYYNPALLPQTSLSGQLSLQGQPDASGITLTLHPGETYAIGPYTATTASNGTFDFGDVVQDSYLLTTFEPGYLNLSADLGKMVTVSDDTTLNPLRLIGGNAIWQEEVNGEWVPNQVIDIYDVALITGEMYGQAGTDLSGDVNGDGLINIIDLALVKGNFGLTAAEAYQSWQP